MYCNYCGNSLSDNSIFCSSCGYQVNPTKNTTDKTNNKEIALFSKDNLILYVSWWSVVALFFLIFIWYDNRSILPALFVLPIYLGMPLIIYTFFHCKRKKEQKVNDCVESKSSIVQRESNEMSLLDFAQEFGKMQVCKVADRSGNIHSKCIFTKVTEVKFSNSIGELTASEISENKQNLVVSRTIDGQFELIIMNGTSLKKASESELPPPIDKILE